MAPARRPLEGRRVLVTRPAARCRDLALRIEALGARLALRPTIAFEPPSDPSAYRTAIERIDRYDLIVFTSATGVRRFVKGLESRGQTPANLGSRIAAIGPGTASALREFGLNPDRIATDSRSEGLAAALREDLVAGAHVLCVLPESGRDLLPEALRELGAIVDSPAFYRTVEAKEAAEIAADIVRGEYDAVVFTSPSSLACLLAAGRAGVVSLRLGLGLTRIVTIGPVTAAAVEAAGLTVAAVAESPSAEGIVGALLHSFAC